MANLGPAVSISWPRLGVSGGEFGKRGVLPGAASCSTEVRLPATDRGLKVAAGGSEGGSPATSMNACKHLTRPTGGICLTMSVIESDAFLPMSITSQKPLMPASVSLGNKTSILPSLSPSSLLPCLLLVALPPQTCAKHAAIMPACNYACSESMPGCNYACMLRRCSYACGGLMCEARCS